MNSMLYVMTYISFATSFYLSILSRLRCANAHNSLMYIYGYMYGVVVVVAIVPT